MNKRMRGMSGQALADRLVKNFKRMKVLYISGYRESILR
jgi:FixJ family two-component response regulator